MRESGVSSQSVLRRHTAGDVTLVVVLIVVSVVMPAWTWRAWADPLIDFGREVYIPWRMTCGEKLYVDLAYFNGPLSPYVNYAIFSIASPSIEALFGANYVLSVVLAGFIYWLMSFIANQRCALFGLIVFQLLFAFGHYVIVANYNFVAPYSHEMTHGLLVSLGCFLCLKAWLVTGRWWWCFVAGALLATVFLTKPEFFVALALGVAVLFGLHACVGGPRSIKVIITTGVSVVVGMVVLLGIAFLLLNRAMSVSESARAMLGAWPNVFNPELIRLPFYENGMGVDAPGKRVIGIVFWLLIQAVALRMAMGRRTPGSARSLGLPDAIILGAAMAPLAVDPSAAIGGLFFASLPVWLGVIIIVGAIFLLRMPDPDAQRRLLLGIAFAAYSLGLLAKILLNTRIYHYGFALTLPGVLTIVMAVWWLRREVRFVGRPVLSTYAPLLIVGVAACCVHLLLMSRSLSEKSRYLLCDGQAVVRTTPMQAGVMNLAITEVLRVVPEDASLAVWPEGAMINVLTRRRNSTPYTVLMPPEVIMFGEDVIVERVRQSPPDYILIVNKDTAEYGSQAFGRGYAENLVDWINDHYIRVASAGAEPFQREFGMCLMQHWSFDDRSLVNLVQRSEGGAGCP